MVNQGRGLSGVEKGNYQVWIL